MRERDTEKLGRVGPLKSGMDRRQRIKTKGSLTVHEPNSTDSPDRLPILLSISVFLSTLPVFHC